MKSRGQRNDKRPLSLFSSHGRWKLRDFFCFCSFNPFLRSIKQHVCILRIIWKCAIAHRSHVVFFFSALLCGASFSSFFFFFSSTIFGDRITQPQKISNKFSSLTNIWVEKKSSNFQVFPFFLLPFLQHFLFI